MNRSLQRLLLLPLLCLLLAAVAVVAVWPHFDGLYGQDSFAYYNYASGPLDEALHQSRLPPAFFWPPGFPLLIWLAMRFVEASPQAGQLVALAAGALVPLLTALLAWELFLAPPAAPKTEETGRGDGRFLGASWEMLPLLAGLLVALQGQLWQSSLVVMADTPALAAATAGVWLAARWGRTGRLPALLLAAGLLSLAVLIRWAYALVAIPVTLYALYRLLRMAQAQGTSGLARPLVQAFAASLVVVLVLLPLWLPAGRALLAATPAEDIAFAGDLAVYRWSPFNLFRRTFSTTDGQLSYRVPNGLYYALAPAHRYYFTPWLALLLLPGLWRLWRERNAARLCLVAGWAAVVIAFHAGAPWQNFRFTLVYLPPLALLAALGAEAVWRWLRAWKGRTQSVARLFFTAYLLVGLALMSWGGWTLSRHFVERKQADLATVAWLEAHTPADAQVLAFGLTATLEHYSSRQTHHLFYETPESVSALVASGQPLFVLLEIDTFRPQWAGHQAEQSFRWLQEQRGLRELGRDRHYVLYQVAD